MDTEEWKRIVEVHEAMSDDDFSVDERPSANKWGDGTFKDLTETPNHYARYPIEPKNFIIRNGMEFWRGNIIKYASRAGSKIYDGLDEVDSEILDLQKAIRYANMRINQLNGEYDL